MSRPADALVPLRAWAALLGSSAFEPKEMGSFTDDPGSWELALFTMMKHPWCDASHVPVPTGPSTMSSWTDPEPVGSAWRSAAFV